MMNIAIIDADIVGKKHHRFPNLACMKLSQYHKNQGHDVRLVWSYTDLDQFDKVFISKVFTATPVPDGILELPNVEYGGTGFFYDKAPPLSPEIEHCKPDYHLYDAWIASCLESEKSKWGDCDEAELLKNEKSFMAQFSYYTDYSIGFLTRGCFRQCQFCVNKNYKSCQQHSSVYEFMDESRPKLCFLDDNFFACPQWREIISEVKKTGKRFQFKQGLDERLLTEEKIHELAQWKYDGDYIFAFDNWDDREVIENKLQMIYRLYPNWKKRLKFYVFCGFDRRGIYDDVFWLKDIILTFKRCFVLAKYSALPYIMRYEKAYTSPFSGLYSQLASWCNQPSFFKKTTFRQFCMSRGMNTKVYKSYKDDPDKYISDGYPKGASWRDMESFEKQFPVVGLSFFDISGDSESLYGSGKTQRMDGQCE